MNNDKIQSLGYHAVNIACGLALIALLCLGAFDDSEARAEESCLLQSTMGKPTVYSHSRRQCELDPDIPPQYRFKP